MHTPKASYLHPEKSQALPKAYHKPLRTSTPHISFSRQFWKRQRAISSSEYASFSAVSLAGAGGGGGFGVSGKPPAGRPAGVDDIGVEPMYFCASGNCREISSWRIGWYALVARTPYAIELALNLDIVLFKSSGDAAADVINDATMSSISAGETPIINPFSDTAKSDLGPTIGMMVNSPPEFTAFVVASRAAFSPTDLLCSSLRRSSPLRADKLWSPQFLSCLSHSEFFAESPLSSAKWRATFSLKGRSTTWQFFATFLGWLSDPFKR